MDLPAIARRPFTEVDGSVGKVVLVYPPEQGLSVWNGRDLLRIASVLQTIKLDNGKVIETSGFAVVFGSMIRSVLHDGPDRHHRVAGRGPDHHHLHDPAGGGGADGAGDARCWACC